MGEKFANFWAKFFGVKFTKKIYEFFCSVNFWILNSKFGAKFGEKFANFFMPSLRGVENAEAIHYATKSRFCGKKFSANSHNLPKKFTNFALLFFAAFFLNACDFNRNFAALNSQKQYKFEFNGFEKRLHFGSQKPFGLVFFGKNCGVCKAQMRVLNELKNAQEFDFFVVLNEAANKADATLYAQDHDIKFPLFYEQKASEFLARAVGGIYGVPVIVFFDKEGLKTQTFIGFTPQNVLDKVLLNLSS